MINAELEPDERTELLRLVEAVLFAAVEPLDEKSIAAQLPKGADIPTLLDDLRRLYAGRGVNLVNVAGKWVLRTAPDLADKLKIERQSQRRLSRAAHETLAVIAYHQPVTRAEIEEIRGVSLSKGTMDALFEATWIKPGRRRNSPGRPLTWVTTETFLSHFGLESLKELPGIQELKSTGLIDSRPAVSIYASSAGIDELPFDSMTGEDESEPETPEPLEVVDAGDEVMEVEDETGT
ncbi:MAG: SMC-Scp complex subunit ScpB [Alphaproteobacteria bacterium]|nr:SMC-Scp complex subunit ScpB [Alphaproteobacteria bacterium]|tara:strand:+ start:398 stop:1105 length:708 start_codon:yes stop_codon:yes gene_type:complete